MTRPVSGSGRQSAPAPRWEAVPPALPPVHLGGLWALFNPVSGETHLIDEAAMAVLDSLSGSAADLARLIERLRRQHGLGDEDFLLGQVDSLLQRLDHLGLVERRP